LIETTGLDNITIFSSEVPKMLLHNFFFPFSMFYNAGSVKSLISLPCFMSHASIPAAVRDARGLTEDLVRISVGIEDVEDLIDDLDYAIKSGPE
jgi:cystathionine beta-lyase/cystathionine gamma-synthase